EFFKGTFEEIRERIDRTISYYSPECQAEEPSQSIGRNFAPLRVAIGRCQKRDAYELLVRISNWNGSSLLTHVGVFIPLRTGFLALWSRQRLGTSEIGLRYDWQHHISEL